MQEVSTSPDKMASMLTKPFENYKLCFRILLQGCSRKDLFGDATVRPSGNNIVHILSEHKP